MHTNRLGQLFLAIFVALGMTGALSFAAQAADFRYWSFWIVQDASWALPQQAPEERQLSDMDVDGWHFGVWGDDGGESPRALPSFQTLCPSLAAATPNPAVIRAAVVIDPGVATDAPTGDLPGAIRTVCLSLPVKSTSLAALNRAAQTVRRENNVLCAIDNYPRTECAPQIGGITPPPATTSESVTPSASASASDSASPSVTESQQKSSWAKVSPILLGTLGSLLLVGGVVLAITQRPRR